MPVNVSDRILILENNESKLVMAIRESIGSFLEKYRQSYLPGIAEVPSAGAPIPVGDHLTKGQKATYRSRVRVCQLFEHYLTQDLGKEFIYALESYLKTPAVDRAEPPGIRNADVAKQVGYSTGRVSSSPFGEPIQLLLLTLASRRILLLPIFNSDIFMPQKFGPDGAEHCIDLLHSALRELVFSKTKHLADRTNIDWSVTVGSKATGTTTEDGSDYEDWKPDYGHIALRGLSLSVGTATTWHDIDDVTQTDLAEVYDRAEKQSVGHRAVKLYLNCLYLNRKSDLDRDAFFDILYGFYGYRIYTIDYVVLAKRKSNLLKRGKRSGERAEVDMIRPPKSRHHILAKKIEALSEYFITSEQTDADFISALKAVHGLKLMIDLDKLPANGAIPKKYGFDWHEKMKQWAALFAYFRETKGYETEVSSLGPFTAFFVYLGAYLPAWCQKHRDAALKFPENVVDFKGALFVHRGNSISTPDHDVLPLTFRQFAELYHADNKQGTLSSSVRVVRDMFAEVIPSGDLIGIPHTLSNPVRDSAVPKSGGRYWGSNKADIPIPVFFLMLLYCYRLLDYMQKINAELMSPSNAVLSQNLYRFAGKYKTSVDEYGVVGDIASLDFSNINTSAKFDGEELCFNVVPLRFFHPVKFNLKERGDTYLLNTGPLEHVILMLETGLRGQSIQWLDTDFDRLIRNREIDSQEMYPLWVNTDKAKDSAWVSWVSGRVINILRERRNFRGMLADQIFAEDIYYECNPKSKWGKFKPVFSINPENGKPHSDDAYTTVFKQIFYALQRYVDELKLNYVTWVPDADREEGYWVDATPHAARKAVIRVHINFLPEEYIGKYITGQTPRSVAYYNALNPEAFDRVDNRQLTVDIIDAARASVDTTRGPSVTTPHLENSPVVRGFTTDVKQAAEDLHMMSTAFFDEVTIKGADAVREGLYTKFTFEPTHMCPYGSKCPPDRHKLGMVRRCNICDHACRTVDHLPAIASEIRNLEEECISINKRLDCSRGKYSEAQRLEMEARRRDIAEETVALKMACAFLDRGLEQLRGEHRKNPGVFCFTPEIVLKNLQAGLFPNRSDEIEYLLSRLAEAKNYFSLNDKHIKSAISKLSRKFLSHHNESESLLGEDFDRTAAEAYSLFHSYMDATGMSISELAKVLTMNPNQLMGPVNHGNEMLSMITRMLPIDEAEGGALQPLDQPKGR